MSCPLLLFPSRIIDQMAAYQMVVILPGSVVVVGLAVAAPVQQTRIYQQQRQVPRLSREEFPAFLELPQVGLVSFR